MSSADTETPGTHAADSPASGGEGAAPKVGGLIGSDVFATLLAPAACTVSIYLSNTPTDHDRRGPDARLRNLVQLADERLERRGMELRVRDLMLEPLRQFAAGTDFARHRDPCVALFTRSEGAPDGEGSDAGGTSEGAPTTGMITIPLPWTRADEAVVGPDFHIKPLLPMLALDRRFNILALSKSNVRLLSATPFDWTAVPLEALPIEAQAELASRLAADTASTDEARMASAVLDRQGHSVLT